MPRSLMEKTGTLTPVRIVLAEEFSARGVAQIKPLRHESSGMRDSGIRTAEGHRLMFGEPCEPEAAQP